MRSCKKDIAEIGKLFHSETKQILIFSHTNPDGDAVGSGLAMQMYLEKLGHDVKFILPDTFPDFLSWLPKSKSILNYEFEKSGISELISKADCFIFVDLNAIRRVDNLEHEIQKRKEAVYNIIIDHHISPESDFSATYWDTSVSSTSELIYELIEQFNETELIDREIAECLYTGIITDTGSLSYSCNNPNTYHILKVLIEKGVDAALIHNHIYNSFTKSQLMLLGYSLSEKLIVDEEKGGAYIFLSTEDLKKYKYCIGDTEGLVNYTLKMKDIKFGALLTDMQKYIKISLRSVGELDVNAIARRHFIGGGHKNASGANYYGSLKDACKIIDKIIATEI